MVSSPDNQDKWTKLIYLLLLQQLPRFFSVGPYPDLKKAEDLSSKCKIQSVTWQLNVFSSSILNCYKQGIKHDRTCGYKNKEKTKIKSTTTPKLIISNNTMSQRVLFLSRHSNLTMLTIFHKLKHIFFYPFTDTFNVAERL